MPRGIENQILRDKDDGLAAILAARIRTKAELKQVRHRICLLSINTFFPIERLVVFKYCISR